MGGCKLSILEVFNNMLHILYRTNRRKAPLALGQEGWNRWPAESLPNLFTAVSWLSVLYTCRNQSTSVKSNLPKITQLIKIGQESELKSPEWKPVFCLQNQKITTEVFQNRNHRSIQCLYCGGLGNHDWVVEHQWNTNSIIQGKQLLAMS